MLNSVFEKYLHRESIYYGFHKQTLPNKLKCPSEPENWATKSFTCRKCPCAVKKITRFLDFFWPNLPGNEIWFGKWHPGWGREIAKPLFTVCGQIFYKVFVRLSKLEKSPYGQQKPSTPLSSFFFEVKTLILVRGQNWLKQTTYIYCAMQLENCHIFGEESQALLV